MVDPTTERHRWLADTVCQPIGRAEVLVVGPLTRRAHRLAAELAALGARCRTPRTLAQHAAALGGAHLATPLEELAARGLLVSDRSVAEALSAPGSDDGGGTLRALAIPTRGRPRSVARAVASHVVSARAAGRPLTVVVAAGGDEREQRATRDALAGDAHADVRIVDAATKRAFIGQLAGRAGVEAALLDWALGVEATPLVGAGGERNALLLDGAGAPLAFADDDTLAELRSPAGADGALAVTGSPDPTEQWFADPGQEVGRLGRPTEEDPFGVHELLLGRTLSSLVTAREPVHTVGVTAAVLRAAAKGGRVLWTQLGTLGDTGTGSMGGLLLLTGAPRSRLLVSEERFLAALATRQVARSVVRATVSRSPRCMSLALAVDARATLPPMPPVLRNADGVFGALMHLCHPTALRGDLPRMVLHEPPEPRVSSFDDVLAGTQAIDANDLLLRLLGGLDPARLPAEPAQVMEALGVRIAGWGALPAEDLEELSWLTAMRTRAADVAAIEHLLRVYRGEPGWWATRARRLREALREHVQRRQHVHARDLVAAFGPTAGVAAFGAFLRRFGALLQAWPTLWEHARALAVEGVRPSSPRQRPARRG